MKRLTVLVLLGITASSATPHAADAAADGDALLPEPFQIDGVEREIQGRGNGPIAAYMDGLRTALGIELRVADFREHALGSGDSARADGQPSGLPGTLLSWHARHVL